MNNQLVLTLRKPWEISASALEWVIDQIIPAGMLTILSGKDKLGKTLLAWEFCRSVLQGIPFVGQFPATQGPVVFLALDDPATVTSHRLDHLGLVEQLNLDLATPADCNFASKEFWTRLGEEIDRIHPRLLIIDSLYLLLPAGAESMNQAGGMGPLMNEFNKICERTGAAILLITHDTKQGDTVAGSFVIRAAAKQILRLTAVQNDPQGRVLHVEGKLVEKMDWSFNFKGPGEWSLIDSQAKELATTAAAVRDHLDRGAKGTSEEIAQAIAKRRTVVDSALRLLVKEGFATCEKVQGRRGQPRKVYQKDSCPGPETLELGQESAA